MTTPSVLEAANLIIEGIETKTVPPGLERREFFFTSGRQDRHIAANSFYGLLLLLTDLPEGTVKREVRELVRTGQLVREGESTATTYTLPRVKEAERQARTALDARLRQIGARLEVHALQVIYRFRGYAPDVIDLSTAREGSLVAGIKLGTDLGVLADLLDAYLPGGQGV